MVRDARAEESDRDRALKCFGVGARGREAKTFGAGGRGERKRWSTKKGGGIFASRPITFTGENASLLAIAERRRGNRTVDCVVRDTSQTSVSAQVENAAERRDVDRREEKFEFFFQCNSSFDEWMFDEYAFTEVCFSTDGASIVAKVQRISDENDWTMRGTFGSDDKTNVSNDGNINSNQELSTSNPFPASSAYSDIFR